MPVLLIGLLLLLLEVALFLRSGIWESFTWCKMTEDFWARHPDPWTGLQWVLHRVAVSWSLIVVGACATYYLPIRRQPLLGRSLGRDGG